MPISVVIPARNAEGTLGETLASLRAQTRTDWEAIVVDDGSTDRTLAVARSLARDDPRIRVLEGPAAGVSDARNAGLADAVNELLLFLDADDLVLPSFLTMLGRELERDPKLAAVHCGWARLAPDGTPTGELLAVEQGDLYPGFARECLFPIHACLVRTELVRAVGGFDTNLVTCEDWDLWLRVARTGLPFAAVPDVLALYRMRERSASVDGRRMLEDGLEVLARACREDPRVPAPADRYREGLSGADLPSKRLYHSCWTAGLVLGSGGDACDLLGAVEDDRDPALDPEGVAHTIFVSALLPRCLTPAGWPALWTEIEGRTRAFLAGLGRVSTTGSLAIRAERSLARLILDESDTRDPVRLGGMLAVELELTEPIADLELDVGVDRVLCRAAVHGDRIGTVELPVCDSFLPGTTLADAAAAAFAWPLLERFLEQAVYPQLAFHPGQEGVAAFRQRTLLADGLPAAGVDRRSLLHDAVGWAVLLQELFGLPDWPERRFYEWDGAAIDCGQPERCRVVEVSRALPALDAPDGPIDVLVTVGGSAAGLVRVEPVARIVPPDRLVRAAVGEFGFELARLAVREGVLGRPLGPDSLRGRLAAAAGERAGSDECDPTLVLCRRRPYELGGAASRRASLPVEAENELLEAASLAGERVVRGDGAVRQALYEPSALAAPDERSGSRNGWRPGRDFFESMYVEQNDPWDYTNPYEVMKYDQTLELVPKGVRRALEIGCAEGHFTELLAEQVGTLVAADISRTALERARERCARFANVEFELVDLATDVLPDRLDLVVCSELLYYVGGRSELDRVAAKLASALRPGGCLVTAHAHVVADEPGRPGFVWDVPFGAAAIDEALRGPGRLLLEHELRTPFYRVQRFRRATPRRFLRRRPPVVTSLPVPAPLPAHVAATARWEGMDWPQGVSATPELPILMYHRVASTGGEALARYRITPERLERQLRILREAGFRSVGCEEVGRALRARRPLPGRAVMLTFDDGFGDFLTDAWPLLREHGLGATLFVVTDRVGGTNDWDAAYGDPAELLGWDELRQLVRQGVEIGSHTASHPHLTALAPAAVVREAARSRAAILRELAVEPAAIAYPYGDVDGGVRHLVGGVGYAYGVSTEGGRAPLTRDPLDLPRIEVTGELSDGEFVQALGIA